MRFDFTRPPYLCETEKLQWGGSLSPGLNGLLPKGAPGGG